MSKNNTTVTLPRKAPKYDTLASGNHCQDQDAVWVVDTVGPKELCIRWSPDLPIEYCLSVHSIVFLSNNKC